LAVTAAHVLNPDTDKDPDVAFFDAIKCHHNVMDVLLPGENCWRHFDGALTLEIHGTVFVTKYFTVPVGAKVYKIGMETGL
jgi:hypothetical protein